MRFVITLSALVGLSYAAASGAPEGIMDDIFMILEKLKTLGESWAPDNIICLKTNPVNPHDPLNHEQLLLIVLS